jgi:hypothetical protein
MIIALALDRTMVPICTDLRYWKTTVDGRVTNIDTNVKKAITHNGAHPRRNETTVRRKLVTRMKFGAQIGPCERLFAESGVAGLPLDEPNQPRLLAVTRLR